METPRPPVSKSGVVATPLSKPSELTPMIAEQPTPPSHCAIHESTHLPTNTGASAVQYVLSMMRKYILVKVGETKKTNKNENRGTLYKFCWNMGIENMHHWFRGWTPLSKYASFSQTLVYWEGWVTDRAVCNLLPHPASSSSCLLILPPHPPSSSSCLLILLLLPPTPKSRSEDEVWLIDWFRFYYLRLTRFLNY